MKKLEWRDRSSEGEYAIRWDTRGSIFTYVAKAVRLNDMILCNGRYHANIEAAKAAAQSDYEQRIRSALVDVPVEPVAWQWRTRIKGGAWDAWENGRYGQPVPPFMDVEERPLYASSLAPHREGEDSAKAEAITSLESGQ